MLVDLASQEQSFIKCRGRMGVPISFLSKAIPVNGVFYRNNGAKIDHAVAVHNNGKVNFYELLDNLGDAKIDGKKKFSRILIWEVFPRRLTENEWREHVHNVCGGKNGRND